MIKIAICDDSIEFNEILMKYYRIKSKMHFQSLLTLNTLLQVLRIWTHLRNIMTTTELT